MEIIINEKDGNILSFEKFYEKLRISIYDREIGLSIDLDQIECETLIAQLQYFKKQFIDVGPSHIKLL